MFRTQLVAPDQRADAARNRIAEATADDPAWLSAAQVPYCVAHCFVPATSAQRWAAVHEIEDLALVAEQGKSS